MPVELPENQTEKKEEQRVFVNLGEGKEEDMKEFARQVESHGGRLDILMHPFFSDYYGRREDLEILKKYKPEKKETTVSRMEFSEKGIVDILNQHSPNSTIPENLKSAVLILEEGPSIGFLEKSLRKREVDAIHASIFVIPTYEGRAELYMRDIEKTLFGENNWDTSNEHAYFVLGTFLKQAGVKSIRLSGGYVTLESNPDEKEILMQRCAGYFYQTMKVFIESQDPPPFTIQMSNFTYPENRSSVEQEQNSTGGSFL